MLQLEFELKTNSPETSLILRGKSSLVDSSLIEMLDWKYLYADSFVIFTLLYKKNFRKTLVYVSSNLISMIMMYLLLYFLIKTTVCCLRFWILIDPTWHGPANDFWWFLLFFFKRYKRDAAIRKLKWQLKRL